MTMAFANPPALLTLVAVAVLLAGCFESEQPKFPLASAVAPLGENARYVVHERVGRDRNQRQEVFAIRRRGDGAYDITDEKGETLTISLHALGAGLFAGQAKAQTPDRSGYDYVVFRVGIDEILVYLPQCGEQEKATLDAFGVVPRDSYNCSIDAVADPAGLFARLRLGNPASKLVRE
jgi:hypothetical protein